MLMRSIESKKLFPNIFYSKIILLYSKLNYLQNTEENLKKGE